MRTRACIVAMAAMLLVAVVGCTTPAVEQEMTYKTVSLGAISASIPKNLERSQQEPLGEPYEGTPEAITLDTYESTSGEVQFLLAEVDMKETQEFWDGPWEGWEALEEMGVTKGTAAEYLTLNFILRNRMGIWAPNRSVNRELVVANMEAQELWYGSEVEDKRTRHLFLVVFGDEYIWLILYSVGEDVWEKYEESWDMIRDSVKLNFAD